MLILIIQCYDNKNKNGGEFKKKLFIKFATIVQYLIN